MKAQHFVLTPDRREPALHVVGTDVVVLASNAATQSFGITYQQGDEGTGRHEVLAARQQLVVEVRAALLAEGALGP